MFRPRPYDRVGSVIKRAYLVDEKSAVPCVKSKKGNLAP